MYCDMDAGLLTQLSLPDFYDDQLEKLTTN